MDVFILWIAWGVGVFFGAGCMWLHKDTEKIQILIKLRRSEAREELLRHRLALHTGDDSQP